MSSVGERSKDNDFAVVSVDGVSEFIANVLQQLLQFTVVFRCDVGEHNEQQIKIVEVFAEIIAPLHIVHIVEVDFRLFATDKHSVFAVVEIKTIGNTFFCGYRIVVNRSITTVIIVNDIDSFSDVFLNSFEREAERVYRTLQSFQQVCRHQFAQSLLASVY